MSRSYNMSVYVTEFQPERADAIRQAAQAEWNFEWCQDVDGDIYGDADGSLGGGETEEEFVDRLSQAIWQANGGFCELQIIATYLESLPHESYYPTPEDYHRLTRPSREVPARRHQRDWGPIKS
ncbi:MAG: hypothetical protein AB7O62_15195 [Pirellulales bacterium]